MTQRIIDVRSRPAFLHDFYGARRGTPEFETAKWLNRRVGSKDDEHFVRSHTLEGFQRDIRNANITTAVVIGRDTPAIQNTNDDIAKLVAGRGELIGVGSVDPDRLGADGAVQEAERAVHSLGLKAINLEPGFGTPARHFDDRLLFPVYEALQGWGIPVFLMSGPTTPDLNFNNPAAIGRVARAFPDLSIVVHHGAWPNVLDIIGVAFRYANVSVVPDMYIFLPGGSFYVEAANGFMREQLLFGSSFPFRDMAQSVQDYQRLGFNDAVLESIMFGNANRLLKLGL
ncbi:amidohydrolase family protein [Hyphomicrobium sp.]|uniref:amidohydrolase family protein n=1 Tax=Hyphomicrobium sp. TaxID=82 RepID=UPI001D66ACA6|nr:amidohydrolase family protein [Hyphomicrobium sp.]MBY0558533.1 amidohydrolase family protein [Hyphomicrobium sp.]